jgi:hypothetical protein
MEVFNCSDTGFAMGRLKKKHEMKNPNLEEYWSIMREVEKICKLTIFACHQTLAWLIRDHRALACCTT